MKIILVMAVTVDGKIAQNQAHFPDWTSQEDKEFFKEFSKKHKVVLMGENTFKTLKKPLLGRLNVVFSEKNLQDYENVLYVSGKVEEVVKDLEAKGYKSAVLGGGAYLNSQFLKAGLIDEIFLTIEPLVFGKGISLFIESFLLQLELIEFKKLNNNSVLLGYKVIK